MTKQTSEQLMGLVATYISGAIDELYSEYYHLLNPEDRIVSEFHDVANLMETHLDNAAHNIFNDLEDFVIEEQSND